jgi:homopolymeric O-antigen transport system permease protein
MTGSQGPPSVGEPIAVPSGVEREAASEGYSLRVIQPSAAWGAIDFPELWRYRELLYFFVWRDVKVRYKQTGLGIAWAIIQPLLGMIIFAFFFGRIARLPSDGIPYSLFAYTALVPWTFFSNAVSAGGQSLLGSAHLITKVYFPRTLTPLAAVLTAVVDFVLAFLMIVPLMLYHGVAPSRQAAIWVPVATVICLLLAVGMALWLSVLVVRFRDLRHVVPFALQIWLFATPIVYPLSMVPDRYRAVVALNPMVSVIDAFRGALFGRPFDAAALLWSGVAAVLLILTGGVYFRRFERHFADVI